MKSLAFVCLLFLTLVACEPQTTKEVQRVENLAFKDGYGTVSWRVLVTATDGSTCTLNGFLTLGPGQKLSCEWQTLEEVK